MAYSHSFSPEIYGDPYETLVRSDRPTTVVQALYSMPDEEWDAMAEEVFGVSGEHLAIDDVLSKIVETDTVGSLESPVDFWIDEEGYYTVEVYDPEEEE